MPFQLRRPLLLARGVLLNRGRPDLARLRSLTDPERFGWAILPHVARSFAASIVLLPHAQAQAALVGYLYSRMLDTFEDMVPDHRQRTEALEWFATRLSPGSLADPGPSVEVAAAQPREEVHRLLVERRELVDRLYKKLHEDDRARVEALVGAMAASMQRWSETFAEQGGVLETKQQLRQYCDDVIGEPARFVMSLVGGPIQDSHQESISTISEMVQLANVTRDIEHDLQRSIGYHPALRPLLGSATLGTEAKEAVRKVREELLVRALKDAPAYARLLKDLTLPRFSSARGSAVLLLLFTDRHYRACSIRVGREPWGGADSTVALFLNSLLSVISRRWGLRTVHRVEVNFLAAANAIEERE